MLKKDSPIYHECQKLHLNTNWRITFNNQLLNDFQQSRMERIHQKKSNQTHNTRFQIWEESSKYLLEINKGKIKILFEN